MSDTTDTTILQGPNGRLYEIPNRILAEYAVPGERVAELRKRAAKGHAASKGAAQPDAANPSGRAQPGASGLPPGAGAMPSGPPAMPPGHAAMPPRSMTVNPGGGVVLNFYFQAPAGEPGQPVQAPAVDLEAYHMTFDENGIPINHTDMLWGDYIDKQGNPAVGWHSHDPVTGNAQ